MTKLKRELLSWYETRNCWRKKYRGHTYYLGRGGAGPNDVEAYTRGLSEFVEIKKRVDAGLPGRIGEQVDPLNAFGPPSGGTFVGYGDWSALPKELPASASLASAERTLDELIAAWVKSYYDSAARGERAISTYRSVKDAIEDFAEYARHFSLVYLNRLEPKKLADYLADYRERQLNRIAAKECSAFTARSRLAMTKRFFEYLRSRDILTQLPGIVAARGYAKVKLPPPDPHPFTLEEVRGLWKAATVKHKFARHGYRSALFLLLGVNGGFRSTDIATLEHSHLVEFEGATCIVRTRNKTGSPQICKLWPLTARLLKEEMTDPRVSKFCLLDERGEPLVRNEIDKKTMRMDNIGRAFFRLVEKAGLSGANRGHACCRDTGAQVLKDMGVPPHILSQYLSHANKEVSKFYANETLKSRAELFAATDEMERYFNLSL